MIVKLALALLVLGAPVAAQSTPILERREVRVDGHPMSVWSKRPPTPVRRSILLLHGRTWSARPNFDLQHAGSSLMDALVRRGYAVYALDQRGYGGTPRDATGWLTPDRAARDVAAVLDWVQARQELGNGSRARRTPVDKPVLLGYSRGAQVAALVAQRHPDKLSALVLYGYPDALPPDSAPARVPDPAAPPRERTTEAAAGEDFISPAVAPRGVKEAYVRAAMAADSVRADWRLESQLDAIDPARVRVPTLMLDGARDPYANPASRTRFFSRLGTRDRHRVALPSTGHAAHLEAQAGFVNALLEFIERR